MYSSSSQNQILSKSLNRTRTYDCCQETCASYDQCSNHASSWSKKWVRPHAYIISLFTNDAVQPERSVGSELCPIHVILFIVVCLHIYTLVQKFQSCSFDACGDIHHGLYEITSKVTKEVRSRYSWLSNAPSMDLSTPHISQAKVPAHKILSICWSVN